MPDARPAYLRSMQAQLDCTQAVALEWINAIMHVGASWQHVLRSITLSRAL